MVGSIIEFLEEVIFFALYGLSAILFTYFAYKLVFKFTKKSKLSESGNSQDMSYEQRKKAYHKSRIIFQLKLFGISFILGIVLGMALQPLFYSFFYNINLGNGFFNIFSFLQIIIILINTIIIYFIARSLDHAIKNSVITGYFFLCYLFIPVVLLVPSLYSFFYFGGLVQIIISFFGFIISAFLFEYLRFEYIKSYPELFRK